MAKARKDNKGRALRKGESQRTDNTYVYTYTDPFKKRRFVYARDLQTLREKEADLIKNQLDGLDVYVAGSATLNYVLTGICQRSMTYAGQHALITYVCMTILLGRGLDSVKSERLSIPM